MPGLNLAGWITLTACAGQIALAALALTRRARASALALPLATLCLVLFGWNFAALAHKTLNIAAWRIIDASISPLTTPAMLHFLLTFVGRDRRDRHLLVAAWIAFAALALLTFAGFFVPSLTSFATSPLWAGAHLTLAAPAAIFGVARLVAHARAAYAAEERLRARLVLTALAVATFSGTTELWADLGLAVPRLGSAAMLASSLLLSLVALRFRLLDGELGRSAALYALGLASLSTVAYVAVFRLLTANVAFVVLGAAGFTTMLGLAARHVFATVTAERERLERLAALGRVAAQVAHDIKNPLAALRGAVQILQADYAEGRPSEHSGEMLALMLAEIDRLAAIADKYHRLGEIRVAPARVDLATLARSVADLQSAEGARVAVSVEGRVEPCPVDSDLVAIALENLIENAREADSTGQDIVVQVRSARVGLREGVEIVVQDRGAGMPERVRERAFDDFFTTKATGSGLGLPFVRRVIEAHGGSVDIETREGQGTSVRLWLPRGGSAA